MRKFGNIFVWGLAALLAFSPVIVSAPASAQFSAQATYAVGGGSANAQTAAIANVRSLANILGVPISIKAIASNTGAATLSISGLTATAIKKHSPTGLADLVGGEIRIGQIFTAIYDGSVFQITSGQASATITPTFTVLITPGSGTYTPPTGVIRIRVRMVGPGGAGGGASASGATAGAAASGDTIFGSTTAKAGGPGQPGSSAVGGAGGVSGGTGSGPAYLRFQGGAGQVGAYPINNALVAGGYGCSSPFGGAGPGVITAPGTAPKANTGSGGSGGGGNQQNYGGGGGGACGEYVELIVSNPGSISYTLPAAPAGGNGTQAGGNGSIPIIIVEEQYQ